MTDATPSQPTGRRRLVFTAVMFSLPVLFFLLLEGTLRLAGVGDDWPLFIPVSGAEDWRVQNPDVARRYFTQQERVPSGLMDPFPADRDSATYRIFVQGGSSAAGYPYYAGGAFSRMLQQRLQQTFPERRIEVVNTALAAVNSYTLLDFADEIIEQQPDAILIYAGHNEYYGALGVGSSESIGRSRTLVNLYLRLQSLRTVQALRSVLSAAAAMGRDAPDGPPGRTLMERMVGEQKIPVWSPLFDAGLDQFRGNLRDLLDRYTAAGIPVYVATVASNERDHAPFEAGPAPGTDPVAWDAALRSISDRLQAGDDAYALAALDSLLRIDATDARVHFVRARLLDRAGRTYEAGRAYRAARNLDQLRFRAPDTLNTIIRAEVDRAGAALVDVESRLRAAEPDGIIDGRLMLEHLHPNLEGYLLMADAFYRALERDRRIGAWNARVSLSTARRERLVTVVDSLFGAFRLRQLLGSWPFRPPGTFDRSLDTLTARNPDEALALALHRREISWFEATDRLWRRLLDEGRLHEALQATLAIIQQYPFMAAPYAFAGDVLVRQGRLQEALTYYGAATDLEDSPALRATMADIWMLSRRPGQAVPEYRCAVALRPDDAELRLKLAQAQLATGDSTGSRETLRALIAIHPDDARARRALETLGAGSE